MRQGPAQAVKRFFSVAIVCALIAACAAAPVAAPTSQVPTQAPATSSSPQASTPSPMASATGSPVAAIDIPGAEVLDRGSREVADVPAEDLQALSAARNELALDIYRILAAEEGNVILGPDSISNALSMLYAGAGGETADQLRDTMRIPFPDDRFHAVAGALDATLSSVDAAEGIELLRGTRLFGQHGFEFGEPFLETVSRDYGAPLTAVDFIGAPEDARVSINAWVAGLTHDLIKELMPQGTIDSGTRLVITDAQYMKATWLTQFDPAATTDMAFHLSETDTRDVPMMLAAMDLPWTGDETFAAAELPYTGERLAMLVVVPQDMAAFEADLTGDRLGGIVEQLQTEEIPVSLPRFEAKLHSDLLAIAPQLGLHNLSDLRGIGPGLFVSAIEHEAVVKVNEEGTEAAAATGVAIAECACPIPELKADRPFLFFVRDRLTGSILFMGRISDPTTEV